MVNKNKSIRKEFYTHSIIREEKEEKKVTKPSSKSFAFDSKKISKSYETLMDFSSPSNYDNLRKNKKKQVVSDNLDTAIKNQETEEKEVVTEITNDNLNDVNYSNENNRLNNYDYNNEDDVYAKLADQYQDNNEYEQTIISEVISQDELFKNIDDDITENDKSLAKEEKTIISTNANNKTLEQKNEVFKQKVKQETIHQKNYAVKKYVGPSLNFLKRDDSPEVGIEETAEEQKRIIDSLIKNYSIKAHVAKYISGPTVIIYLIEFDSLDEDVKSIRKLEDNLAMYLTCKNIRILTPIPGMRYAGIEVPKPKELKKFVYLGDLLADKEFKNSKFKLPIAVGKNNFGKNIYIDIYDMPHGLCAGATKSGKSVCLNAFIVSLIYKYTPNDVRLILIDPKKVEFGKYDSIPHLALPVVTEKELFEPVVDWLTQEMERRYQLLNKNSCVELAELNEQLVEQNQRPIPYLVMIMDEFNDWFASASQNVENNITSLMQKARAAGIHIILATQRPSADVIKGAIKTNITTRLSFRVTSVQDSIVILGQSAAERLEGNGDMILRHSGMDDERLQGCFVSNKEVKEIVAFLREHNEPNYIVSTEELLQSAAARGAGNGSEDPSTGKNDELFEEVARYVVVNKNASVNQMQKIHGTGFNRMDAIFRDMEKLGIISPAQQGTRRRVLVNEIELDEILKNI